MPGGRTVRVRVHHRIFGGFLLLLVVVVAGIVIAVATGLRREFLVLYRNDLLRELEVARLVVEGTPRADPDSLAGALQRAIRHRVTLIDAAGRVVGDSDVPPAELGRVENHAARPEVRGALEGLPTFSVRESRTVGADLLYGAVPVSLDGRPGVLRVGVRLDDVDAALRRSQLAVVGVGLVGLVVAALLSYLASRSLSGPLVALADRARSLAAGDFSRRAPRGSRVAEVDDVAVAFNRLADELESRLAELARERDEMQALVDSMAEGVLALSGDARVMRANRAARRLLGLPEPIDFAPVGALVRQPELRDLLEEAVIRPFRAREVALGDRSLIVSARLLDTGGSVVTFLDVSELRRLEQVRRDFVANASHELKTPLTSMRGFAETLLEDDPPPPLRREFLESIRNNTLRLQRLVDDLLDLSRLESGGWVARSEEVDVAAAAEDVWEEFAPLAAQRNVSFVVEGAALVSADEQGLTQIFRNLFENSLRYTPDGGRVGVRIEGDRGFAAISVWDTGGGISTASLPRIFERFYRADPGRSRDAGGTGLGLAIVRHLVSAMGGVVSAESQLGLGTTVRFTLPVLSPVGS